MTDRCPSASARPSCSLGPTKPTSSPLQPPDAEARRQDNPRSAHIQQNGQAHIFIRSRLAPRPTRRPWALSLDWSTAPFAVDNVDVVDEPHVTRVVTNCCGQGGQNTTTSRASASFGCRLTIPWSLGPLRVHPAVIRPGNVLHPRHLGAAHMLMQQPASQPERHVCVHSPTCRARHGCPTAHGWALGTCMCACGGGGTSGDRPPPAACAGCGAGRGSASGPGQRTPIRANITCHSMHNANGIYS